MSIEHSVVWGQTELNNKIESPCMQYASVTLINKHFIPNLFHISFVKVYPGSQTSASVEDLESFDTERRLGRSSVLRSESTSHQ